MDKEGKGEREKLREIERKNRWWDKRRETVEGRERERARERERERERREREK